MHRLIGGCSVCVSTCARSTLRTWCCLMVSNMLPDGISVTGLPISSPLRHVLKPRGEKSGGAEGGKTEYSHIKVRPLSWRPAVLVHSPHTRPCHGILHFITRHVRHRVQIWVLGVQIYSDITRGNNWLHSCVSARWNSKLLSLIYFGVQ